MHDGIYINRLFHIILLVVYRRSYLAADYRRVCTTEYRCVSPSVGGESTARLVTRALVVFTLYVSEIIQYTGEDSSLDY